MTNRVLSLVLGGFLALQFIMTGTRPALAEPVLDVIAQGHAAIHSSADRDAARRRAIGDALISAALSGGATLRGHSVQDKGRIVADLTILRPIGQVLSHRVLSAVEQNGLWTVQIAARVGVAPQGICDQRRRLTVSAFLPTIEVSPTAPAWSATLAQQMARDVADLLKRDPNIQVERTTAAPKPTAVSAKLDYTRLTRGHATAAAGDHRVTQSLRVQTQGAMLLFDLDLEFLGQDGTSIQRRFSRQTSLPKTGTAGFMAGQNRLTAEAALTQGLLTEVKTLLTELGCTAPEARLVLTKDALMVPLGQAHGLTRASLAFVDDPNEPFGLLEVIRLKDRETTLRPLDPSRSLASFNGRRVYFLEAGL